MPNAQARCKFYFVTVSLQITYLYYSTLFILILILLLKKGETGGLSDTGGKRGGGQVEKIPGLDAKKETAPSTARRAVRGGSDC